MADQATLMYVCASCFSADSAPGDCPNCGRPPMDADGHILSRAPLWWLARSVPYLKDKIKQTVDE